MTRTSLVLGSISGVAAVALALVLPHTANSQQTSLPAPGSLRVATTTFVPAGADTSSGFSRSWFVATQPDGKQFPVACYIGMPDSLGPKIVCYRGEFPQ
jgi:hypothetical protein